MQTTGQQARVSSLALLACLAMGAGLAQEALAQRGPQPAAVPAASRDASPPSHPAQVPRPDVPGRKHSAFGEAMRNLTQALREAGTPQPEPAASTGPQHRPDPAPTPVDATALADGTTP